MEYHLKQMAGRYDLDESARFAQFLNLFRTQSVGKVTYALMRQLDEISCPCQLLSLLYCALMLISDNSVD